MEGAAETARRREKTEDGREKREEGRGGGKGGVGDGHVVMGTLNLIVALQPVLPKKVRRLDLRCRPPIDES
jgi:hypothetical protein